MYIMISRVITIEVLEKTEKIEDGRHCPRSNNKLMSFLRTWSKFVILVSTIGFSGMPDMVVWPKNTLDSVLRVNPKWPPLFQGQTIN